MLGEEARYDSAAFKAMTHKASLYASAHSQAG
jgi:hypothetical protein